MTDETELNPAQPGEGKVCLETAGEVATPSPVEAAPKKRSRGVDRSSLTPDELKAHKKVIDQRVRQKKQTASYQYNSTVEVKAKEARRILEEERGIRNPRILEISVQLAEAASRNLHIPFNACLFKKGLQGTLAAARKEAPPPFPADVWNPGERVREHELYALWDYSTSWRVQPDGTQLSFEDWKAQRRRCITNIVWFGNHVLGKDFQPQPHGLWASELFPNLEPALLSLPEKFGQKDIARAFRKISDVRQRCLISARSSYKSTFSTIFALQMMLCFAGSIRILVTTATQPLARGFAKSFRNLVTVRDPNNPTLMNQLWPEHSVAPDDGRGLEYTSPFRQLDALIEPTLFITSVISEGQAGSRYDYAVMDDCAEIANSSTPEMREKTQERIDMLRELGEPHSLTTYVGTPISAGMGTPDDPGDLYSVLLMREEKNLKEGGEPKLLYTICPAWTVKPGTSKKAWDPTLTEDEVELLFPSRLTFKYLMAKLKENLATDPSAKIFRQQSLVSWVPDDESQITVTFSESLLRSRLRPRSFFDQTCLPGTPTYLAIDRAFSVARTADYSALAVVRVQPVIYDQEEKRSTNALVVLDHQLLRAKESELIVAICKMIEKHSDLSAIVIEKDRHHEELILGVRKMCQQKSLTIPYIYLKDIKNTPQSKAIRAKQLEAPLEDYRLWFVSSTWNDQLIEQFVRFDGIKKSGSTDGSKDDSVDCCALAYAQWGVKAQTEVLNEDEEAARRKEEDEESRRMYAAHRYNAMFGNNPYSGTLRNPAPPTVHAPTWRQRQFHNDPAPEPEPSKPVDPRLRVFGNKGPWRQ